MREPRSRCRGGGRPGPLVPLLRPLEPVWGAGWPGWQAG
jgi:hypothetical protein